MLEASHIAFSYGSKPLLVDASLKVETGDVVAIAGANGAGKTTLLRILAGLTYPVSGMVLADGLDVFSSSLRYRRALGYLSETAPVEPDMDVKGYLKYRAKLKGEQPRRIRHRVQESIETLGLEEYAETRIDNLSYGCRKRVAIAETILLRPRFLILDDPFAGLDSDSRDAIVKFVTSVSSFASVILTGHEKAEMTRAAHRFLQLKDGVLAEVKSL